MKAVSILALTLALAGGAAQAQQQPLPMPAPDSPPLPVPQDIDYPGTIQLQVDATDLDRHIITVHEIIPVAGSGPMVLLQPKWLPGTHSPRDSDVTKLAGLHITAGGQELKWRRDDVETNAFRFDVPQGVTAITVDFQFLAPVQERDGLIVHTHSMMDMQWENESLYPGGYFTRRIPVQVSLTLPQGWGYGSALEEDHRDNGTTSDVVTFKPITYDNLIDSPLLAGKYFKKYDLDPGAAVPVTLDIAADDPADLDVPDQALTIQKNVVQQAYKLFGARHYNHYDILLAITDEMGGIGLEHHRSSENAVEPGYLRNVVGKGFGRFIPPHEYTHSWDGKFRRPAGQFTATFQEPMRDELLWVYEGGTSYWGELLESRAGLYTFDQRLQMMAVTMASYDMLPARAWRDLQDTTYDPIISNREPKSWPSWQRSEDYYAEGALIWLDADTLIREKTKGKKSLDDFAKAFFGVYDGSFLPAPYTFDDVVTTLNSVYPYDWATFLRTRLDRTGKGAPLDGLTRGGYRLVYDDTASDYIKSNEAKRGANFTYSLGLTIGKDGGIRDVMWDGQGFKAGLTAGMKIISVNGKAYDGDTLKGLITAAHKPGNTDTIVMLVQAGKVYRTVTFDYHDGLRYPHLERIEGTPDLLKPIYTAR